MERGFAQAKNQCLQWNARSGTTPALFRNVQSPSFPGNPNRSHRYARGIEGRRVKLHAAGREPRVLVIEDEAPLGDSLSQILSAQFAVTVVSSATDALELLESGVTYDVVLCDAALPPRGGAALVDRIRASAPDMADRFVFVTTGTSPADAEAAAAGPSIEEQAIDIRALRGVAEWHFSHALE